MSFIFKRRSHIFSDHEEEQESQNVEDDFLQPFILQARSPIGKAEILISNRPSAS